jgi:hypothetical protein
MSYGGGAASAAAARRLSALEGDLAEARREVASERSRADKLQDEVWELRGLLKQSQENYDALVRRALGSAAWQRRKNARIDPAAAARSSAPSPRGSPPARRAQRARLLAPVLARRPEPVWLWRWAWVRAPPRRTRRSCRLRWTRLRCTCARHGATTAVATTTASSLTTAQTAVAQQTALGCSTRRGRDAGAARRQPRRLARRRSAPGAARAPPRPCARRVQPRGDEPQAVRFFRVLALPLACAGRRSDALRRRCAAGSPLPLASTPGPPPLELAQPSAAVLRAVAHLRAGLEDQDPDSGYIAVPPHRVNPEVLTIVRSLSSFCTCWLPQPCYGRFWRSHCACARRRRAGRTFRRALRSWRCCMGATMRGARRMVASLQPQSRARLLMRAAPLRRRVGAARHARAAGAGRASTRGAAVTRQRPRVRPLRRRLRAGGWGSSRRSRSSSSAGPRMRRRGKAHDLTRAPQSVRRTQRPLSDTMSLALNASVRAATAGAAERKGASAAKHGAQAAGAHACAVSGASSSA